MSYQTDHADLQSRLIQQQQETSDAKNWLVFLEKYREVVPCDANFQAVKSYFAGDPFSLESLEEAIQNPSLRKQMVFQTTAEDRIKLLQALKELTGEISAATKYQSTEEIRTKVYEIQRKREMQSKSPNELRQIIKENTPAVEADDLPAHMDRAFLLGLNKPGEFKKVCERYGVTAVTRALNTRR
jgi:hypothetical protein